MTAVNLPREHHSLHETVKMCVGLAVGVWFGVRLAPGVEGPLVGTRRRWRPVSGTFSREFRLRMERRVFDG